MDNTHGQQVFFFGTYHPGDVQVEGHIAALMSAYREFVSERESGFEAERSAKGAGRIEKAGK